MNLWHWLTGRTGHMFIPHWSEDRARHYERATYRMLGIRPEPIYTWSRRLRPKAKLKSIDAIGERKRA